MRCGGETSCDEQRRFGRARGWMAWSEIICSCNDQTNERTNERHLTFLPSEDIRNEEKVSESEHYSANVHGREGGSGNIGDPQRQPRSSGCVRPLASGVGGGIRKRCIRIQNLGVSKGGKGGRECGRRDERGETRDEGGETRDERRKTRDERRETKRGRTRDDERRTTRREKMLMEHRGPATHKRKKQRGGTGRAAWTQGIPDSGLAPRIDSGGVGRCGEGRPTTNEENAKTCVRNAEVGRSEGRSGKGERRKEENDTQMAESFAFCVRDGRETTRSEDEGRRRTRDDEGSGSMRSGRSRNRAGWLGGGKDKDE
ncbi:hypothetical protein C8R45DRAFT_938723 [Mycena sanguinolenta]|nr:hypothetical protein C8R45DRAFT_938723 [Mycena sanguinolenta]